MMLDRACRRVRAFSETNQGVRKMRIGVHGHVTGDVMKDIGLRQVVQPIGRPNGDSGGEAAVAQAVEKNERRHVAAYRLRLKARQRAQEAVHVVEPWNALRVEAERADTLEEPGIGVSLPALSHARKQAPPRLVVLFRVELVRLFDEQASFVLRILDKRSLCRGQARGVHERGRVGHRFPPLHGILSDSDAKHHMKVGSKCKLQDLKRQRRRKPNGVLLHRV
jgi:hypothetical protein